MGMFDSLYVPCGNCGKSVEFQSKAGECICATYTIFDCPPAIAGDLIGQSRGCKCGAIIQVLGSVSLRYETRDAPQSRESP